MAASHFFRLDKIKGKDCILVALKHNKRENQGSKGSPANIDASRTPLNYALVGQQSPQEIATEAKVLMIRAGIEKPRINAVMGVEIIFSLPINRHRQDTRPFFEDCLAWTQQTFDGELLSFDVHLDESAPHAHAIILPLVDGRMKGRDMVGNIGNLTRLRNEFYKAVGKRYGLGRSDRRKLSADDKKSMIREILSQVSLAVMEDKLWPYFRDAIEKDPMPCADLLGIELMEKTNKTFTGIMTSNGRGEANET